MRPSTLGTGKQPSPVPKRGRAAPGRSPGAETFRAENPCWCGSLGGAFQSPGTGPALRAPAPGLGVADAASPGMNAWASIMLSLRDETGKDFPDGRLRSERRQHASDFEGKSQK